MTDTLVDVVAPPAPPRVVALDFPRGPAGAPAVHPVEAASALRLPEPRDCDRCRSAGSVEYGVCQVCLSE